MTMARIKGTPHTNPSAWISFALPGTSGNAPASNGERAGKGDSLNTNPQSAPALALASAADTIQVLDDDDSSVLSEVSEVSALNSNPEQTAPVIQQQGPAGSVSLSEEIILERALGTLKFATDDPSAPSWLTGLSKPLPHPDLTALQDFEIATRLWFDEIARLENLRARLPSRGEGEWRYEHFGSTVEVKEERDGVSRGVLARGVWRLVNGRVVVRQLLDEYPMTLEGEPLGWEADGDLSEFLVKREDKVEEEVIEAAARYEVGDGGANKDGEE